MTQPNPGDASGTQADPNTAAPGAQQQPTTGQQQPTGQQGQDPNTPIDFDNLPANVRQYISTLRQEAGNHRTGRTAAEKAAAEATDRYNKMLAAAGVNPDGSTAVDPEKAYADAMSRAERAEGQVWAMGVRMQVNALAPKLGGDPVALLDSGDFQDLLDDLIDEDPNSPAFATALEAKIRDAVAKHRHLRSAGSGSGRQGADITGSGGGGNGRPTSLAAAIAARNSK